MIYPFKCQCGSYREVIARADEYDPNQKCACGKVMDRIFGFHGVSVPNLDRWNSGLGCREKDVKSTIRHMRDNGRDIAEVGNESAMVKRKESNYDLSRSDVAELQRIMDK